MVVSRECVSNPAIFHHEKGSAVRQRPFFVGPSQKQIASTLEQLVRCRNDNRAWILLKLPQKVREYAAALSGRRQVSEFHQNELGDDGATF
jgi:hypothetical protein